MIPWARCITRIDDEKRVFLTFDDGPHEFTSSVLEALERCQAYATFFVIGQRAVQRRHLIAGILSQGHGIGNHSVDHDVRRFFTLFDGALTWIHESETVLQSVVGHKSVGFRSPAGVRTPVLHVKLAEMRIPWIHWNVRFYDAVWGWSVERARRGVQRLRPGDIVLLHDTQPKDRQANFIAALDWFIKAGQDRGLEFARLEKSDTMSAAAY